MSGILRPPDAGVGSLSVVEIRELLEELGSRIEERHQHVDAYIVGGAAIALGLGFRTSTDDIDGLFSNADLVASLAAEIAAERGISALWLGTHVQAYIPTWAQTDDTEAQVIELRGLTVRLASPRWLLALKLGAGRLKDFQDIVELVRHLDLHDAEEIADWAIDVHGEGSVLLTDTREDLIIYAKEALRLAWPREA